MSRHEPTDDDLLLEFVAESSRLLERARRDLFDLARSVEDPRLLEDLFRCFHTITGSSGWLGFEGLELLSRAGERLVRRMRDGHRAIDRVAIAALLHATDRLREGICAAGERSDIAERGLRELVTLLTSLADRAPPLPSRPSPSAVPEGHQQMLLFRAGGSRLAMPLASVEQLEVFDPAQIDDDGARESVSYRGEVLELVRAVDLLEERRQRRRSDPPAPTSTLRAGVHVVVQIVDGRRVGLIVDRIEDAITDEIEVHDNGARIGVIGSAVIRGAVTEVFDVRAAYRVLDAFRRAART